MQTAISSMSTGRPLRSWLAALGLGLLATAACSAPAGPPDGSPGDAVVVPDTGPPPDVQIEPAPDGTTPDAGPDAGSDGSADLGSDGPGLSDIPPDQPLSPPVVSMDLGAVTSGQPVRFTLPEGTLGFHLTATGRSGAMLGIQSITGPEGLSVVDDYRVAGWPYQTLFSFQGIVSAQVPSSDVPEALPLPAGEWEVILTGEELGGTVHVQATPDGTFQGGVLDLHLYVPVGLVISDPHAEHALTEKDRFTDECILTRIESFFTALEELFELDQGQVYFHPLGADEISANDDATVAVRFGQTAVTGDPRGVHIILQNGVTVQGTEVWGISPGAPGNGVAPGQPNSALLLNVVPQFGARADGYTLVHELGHFVGLLHSSELDGVNADPLTDTPACGRTVTTNPGACPDGRNIMFAVFWGASGGQGIETSPRQRAILHGSPIYRRRTAP